MTTFSVGSTATLTVQWFEYQGGPPSDVNGQTVTITRIADSVVVLGPTAVGITHPATGLYAFNWSISGSEIVGDYVVVWNAIDFQLDPVQASEVVTLTSPVSIAGTGPCGWEGGTPACCSEFWATLTADEQAEANTYAETILWAATGRHYGACEVVARPCGNDRRCGSCGAWSWFDGWMRPYILDGQWRNCLCDCACDCRPSCEVKLPGPVANVSQVMIDGVILAPSAWRVDDFQWLVRTDGECWPRCQDYNVDVPAVGTFQVTYTRGDAVPPALLTAKGTLACEFAKACKADKSCRLPGRLQTLTRQGVTASFVDVDTLLKRGLTGLPEVDAVIVALNPYALKARPFFSSFDTDPRVRVVTQA
jgi:hypothetical protein